MSESIPTVPIRPADRNALEAQRGKALKRDDASIEKIALAYSLAAFRRASDMPQEDAREALSLQAEGMRRAAELVEERLRMMEGKKRA